MAHVIQTETLVAEGILTADQGIVIARRSRQVMVSLAINSVLCLGIIAAAIGFVFLLANALAVAIVGGLFLVAGGYVLLKSDALYQMFGNAAALIGAGMLTFGAMFDLVDKLGQRSGGIALIALGAAALVGTVLLFLRSPSHVRFLTGSLVLLAGSLHVTGLYIWGGAVDLSGFSVPLTHAYVALLMIGAGILIDVRVVTALAIFPFAQVLETGTFYQSAMYAFYSPEPTLSILLMGGAMAVCIALAAVLSDRVRNHTHMFGIMAFIVANLCFLVGSLFGDTVGIELWGPGSSSWQYEGGYENYNEAREAFNLTALHIHEHVYSIIWAIALVIAAAWAAHTNRRGIFNAAMTFGAIHAYTQAFETFYDEPLAYVVGGLAAIPLAWGLWRLNNRFEQQSTDA